MNRPAPYAPGVIAAAPDVIAAAPHVVAAEPSVVAAEPSVVAAAPYVVAAEQDYLVLYKPRAMHTVPLNPSDESTLLHWCAGRFPEVLRVRGEKAVEGGAVHRLDFLTEGLVLFARTDAAFAHFYAEQQNGRFEKEYRAFTRAVPVPPPAGFPPRPAGFPPPPAGTPPKGRPPAGTPPALPETPFTIESAFRPYGPGAKAVRPLPVPPPPPEGTPAGFPPLSAGGRPAARYLTTALSAVAEAGAIRWHIALRRGFRHQIRCHLAWLGFPLDGDTLYGGRDTAEFSLLAKSLRFRPPQGGAEVTVRLP